jgi:hypothetical protein
VLPGLIQSSSEGRPVDEDIESPRRRLDNEVKKSDADEPLFACSALVGVAGGVSAPLSCMVVDDCEPSVIGGMLIGESGGVDTVLGFIGLECLRPGTASLYPSLASVLVVVSS